MKSLPGSQPLLGEIPPNLVAGILGRSYDAAPCLARSGSWFWRRGSWWWCRPRLLTSSLLLCSPRFLSAFLLSLTLLLSALSFSSLSPSFFLLNATSPLCLLSPPCFLLFTFHLLCFLSPLSRSLSSVSASFIHRLSLAFISQWMPCGVTFGLVTACRGIVAVKHSP